MPEFMLLLFNGPGPGKPTTPADMRAAVARYRAWAATVHKDGTPARGQKLADDGGRELTPQDGKVAVTDGPYSETKELLGGYFIVKAANYDEAVAIARGCPHLVARNRIVVRQLDEL